MLKRRAMTLCGVMIVIVFGVAACADMPVIGSQEATSVNTMPIEKGWNGLPWGTTLDQFKARYPNHKIEGLATGFNYRSGGGPQRFLGYNWLVVYNFNQDRRFEGVSLTCLEGTTENVDGALRKAWGRPVLGTQTWTRGDVKVDLMGIDPARILTTHKLYSAPPVPGGRLR